MKPVLMVGMTIVTLALASYSIAIFTAQRKRIASGKVRTFLTLGVILDISATICMIVGSSRAWNEITVHAMLGYSSLGGMLVDTILIWRHHIARPGSVLPSWLHWYSKIAYSWWVIAFITGGLLVVTR